MMAAVVSLVVLLAFYLSYRFYARYLGERVFDDREEIVTPAHRLRDDNDFVPAPRAVLLGHHFTSVAGAAPIIGPCVAAYWGWLPALAWVVLGTIFMGATHDFGSLIASARNDGRSIADIAGSLLGRRVHILFLCFVALMIWLVLAVFAMAIAGLFVSQPTSVLPINLQIFVAVAVGWLIYKRNIPLFWPSLIALILLYVFVWVGTVVPVDFVAMGVSEHTATMGWIAFLFVYAIAASVLPVWLLLQPRDYINSHMLFVGLALLFGGLFLTHPDFDAPAIRTATEDAPSMFPLLFVTIACGAISGFHGLVSSGTSSKQLDKLSDARLVGYGSMLGEGALALASTIAAVAGIGLVGATTLPSHGAVPHLSWSVYYDTWAHAGTNQATAFVLGGGAFLQSLGLSEILSRTLMAVLVIAFAATSLDTAMRIQRFIIAELGDATNLPILRNAWVGNALAALPAMFLAFAETPDPETGKGVAIGWVLWPLFGASNQLLAALTLMTLAVYFYQRKRPILPLLIPTVLVTVVAGIALVAKLQEFIEVGNHLLATLTAVLFTMMVWMTVEGILTAIRLRRAPT